MGCRMPDDPVVEFSITSEDNENFVFGGDTSNTTFTLAETGGVAFTLTGDSVVLEFALAGSIPGPPGSSGSGGDPDLIAQLADDGTPDGVVDGVGLDVLYANRKV